QFGTFQGTTPQISETNQNNFFIELTKYLVDDFKVPSFNSSIKFDFNKIEEAIDMAIMYEESFGNKQIRDYCSTMITRFKSLKERDEFKFLTENEEDIVKENFINQILGVSDDAKKKTQVTIIDLNAVEDEVVEVISSVISRMIFEKLKNLDPRNSFPVNLTLEEAHRY